MYGRVFHENGKNFVTPDLHEITQFDRTRSLYGKENYF